MKITVTTTLDIDEQAWALEYGKSTGEVWQDVIDYYSDTQPIADNLQRLHAFGPLPTIDHVTVDTSLAIIGHERAVIDKFTKTIHDAARRVGEYTGPVETRRGNTFQVRLDEDGSTARVSVDLKAGT